MWLGVYCIIVEKRLKAVVHPRIAREDKGFRSEAYAQCCHAVTPVRYRLISHRSFIAFCWKGLGISLSRLRHFVKVVLCHEIFHD